MHCGAEVTESSTNKQHHLHLKETMSVCREVAHACHNCLSSIVSTVNAYNESKLRDMVKSMSV